MKPSRSALVRSLDVLRYTWKHPGNRSHRLRSLARIVLFQARGRLTGARTITAVGSHSWIWADTAAYISARATYGNPLDWNEMQAWGKVLRPGSLFVDVGANVGLYTIWAIDHGAEVLAIEPNRLSVARLEENLALNGYDAHIVVAAAGDRAGTTTMTTAFDQQNHLLLDGSPSDAAVETVEVRTLDEVVGDRIADGLKVDVEGAEILVLRGASRLLAEQRVKLLQLEWNAASIDLLGQDRRPVRELLASHGYSLFRPDHEGNLVPFDGEGFGADVFAKPS